MLVLVVTAFDARSIEAQSPPAAPAGQADTLAPEFDLENVAGGRTRSAEIQGKIVVLHFWATWAVPAYAQVPDLNKLHDTLNGRDVQVTSIAAESGTAKEIESKIMELGVRYPVLVAVRQSYLCVWYSWIPFHLLANPRSSGLENLQEVFRRDA
jgi:peroxiredoxin